MKKLEENSALALTWFECNYMKLKRGKCHLLVSRNHNEEIFMKIGGDIIWENSSVKLLGMNIDRGLKMDKHINDICAKANRKLSVLSRMCSFLSQNKKRIIFRSFIESQFKYCPLIWMFCSRKSNNKINRRHERSLRIVYNNYNSSLDELLSRDHSMSVHYQNIHHLAIEIYKVANNLSVRDFEELFAFKNQFSVFVPSLNTEVYGKSSLRYFGAVLWNSIPDSIKCATSVKAFESRIKSWEPVCFCRLCKTYLQGVGFVSITN